MKRQPALVISLCAIGIILTLFAVAAVSYISAYNTGNRLEQRIKAEYANNENILAQYGQKMMEAAQVPAMMRDDVSRVIRDALSVRYGPEGAKAVFQAIAEQNPNVSEAVYVKLQQLIEAGRDEFKTGQTRLIDTKRVYETALGSFYQGIWLRIAGYPKLNLADYKVISTDRAEQVFKAGKEAAPLQLRAPASN